MEEQEELLLDLPDAANRFVKNFQQRWLRGLESYAKSHGFRQPATKAQYLDLFIKYGWSDKIMLD